MRTAFAHRLAARPSARCRSLLAAAAVAGLAASPLSAAVPASPLWADLAAGPYAVGFQVLERRDPSRPFRYPLDLEGNPRRGDLSRPLQVSIWYPAAPNGAPPMKLGDYVALMGGEQDFSLDAATRAARGEAALFAFPLARDLAPEARRRLLALPTAAVRDAAPLAGRFPVVLWSLGSPALYQASAEHLASHGYVVAIVPRLPPTRAPFDNSPTSADHDAKSRDLDLLLREVAALPFAEAGNVGVTGFSAGGRWALGAAMRNPAVRALVSQDSILLFPGAGTELSGLPFWEPARVRAPVLHMVRRAWVPQETSTTWNDLAFAARTSVVFEPAELDHLDFASIGHALSVVGSRPEVKELVARTFVAWQNATLWFFDAHLRGDASAAARVAALPASLGLPAGAVTGQHLAAAPSLADDQLAEALVDDFPRAVATYRRLLAERGKPPAGEASLNLGGYGLLELGRVEDAIAAFELNAAAYPTSANVWDSLADGYLAAGDRERAKVMSEKALAALATDTVPEDRRERIRASAQGRLDQLAQPVPANRR
jgi:tetratricopeptide (TPR) repeat protein